MCRCIWVDQTDFLLWDIAKILRTLTILLVPSLPLKCLCTQRNKRHPRRWVRRGQEAAWHGAARVLGLASWHLRPKSKAVTCMKVWWNPTGNVHIWCPRPSLPHHLRHTHSTRIPLMAEKLHAQGRMFLSLEACTLRGDSPHGICHPLWTAVSFLEASSFDRWWWHHLSSPTHPVRKLRWVMRSWKTQASCAQNWGKQGQTKETASGTHLTGLSKQPPTSHQTPLLTTGDLQPRHWTVFPASKKVPGECEKKEKHEWISPLCTP